MGLVGSRSVSKRAGWYADADIGGTFAHKQHSRPEQRLFRHWRYVQTLGTGMLQTGATIASLSVFLS
jgi:hypothetical protein